MKVGYKLYLDFEQYNYLSILQVLVTKKKLNFEEFTISTDFANDKICKSALIYMKSRFVDSFIGLLHT